MAAPINEAELTALLMESPLYKKLENIKNLVKKGGFGNKKAKDGEYKIPYKGVGVWQQSKGKEWFSD